MVPYYLIGKEPFFMKRVTEAQVRQVIREELIGLLNEIEDPDYDVFEEDPEVNVSETGTEIKGKEKLRAVTGAQIIKQFSMFDKMKKDGQVNLIPLPLREFQIDYEILIKNTADQEEVKNKEVIVFYYNHSKLFNRGYVIEMFPLSTGRKPKGQQFVSHEAHEMTMVSRRTDRQDVEKYEKVLGITVPEPKNVQNLTTTDTATLPPMRSLTGTSKEDSEELIARLGGKQGIGLRKGLRENKKRKP
jgi:hypothetical protein